jgi:hypothetical protein
MITKMLQVDKATELQKLLAKSGMIESLISVMDQCQLDTEPKKMLLPIVINRVSLLLKDCDAACQRMSRIDG